MATVLDAPTQDTPRAALPAVMSDARDSYMIMKDKARNFALSALVPQAIKGKSYDEAFANCLIAMEMAQIMGEPPLIVMNHIYIVHGRAGFETKYKIARANKSGIFIGRINWREAGEGDALCVTAFATLAETGEEVSFPVDMAMAKAEGWTSNKKYQTMPKLMLRYRSASMLINLYAPDVMLGYHTLEEHEDMLAAAGPGASTSALLTGDQLIEQAKVPAEEPVAAATVAEAEVVEPEAPPPAPVEEPASAPDPEQGRTDTQHGDPHTDNPIDDWKRRLAAAEVIADVLNVEAEFKAAGQMSDDDETEIAVQINEAKARFQQGGAH